MGTCRPPAPSPRSTPGARWSSSCASGWPPWSAGPPAARADAARPRRPGALHAGATYAVDSASLALALAAGASRAGEWVGFAGWADFGAEAAAELGIELARTVLVPEPGEHWLEVTAALVDVLRVVVLRPPASVDEQDGRDPGLAAAHALLGAGGVGRLAAGRGAAERRGRPLDRARRPGTAGTCGSDGPGVVVRRGTGRRCAPTWPGRAVHQVELRATAVTRSGSVPGERPDEGHGRVVPRLVGRGRAREAERPARSPPRCWPPTSSRCATGPPAGEGVRRGQRRRDAQARCPELVLLARQPRPRRPGLRAGAGHRRGAAPRGGGAAARPARGAGARQLVRRRDRRRRAACQSPGRGGRLGRPARHRRRPVHRRAGGPHRRRAGVGGRPGGRVRGVPARPARARAPGRRRRGRELVEPAAAARPPHPGRPRRPAGRRGASTGWARYGAEVWRRARGEDRALFAARTPPPELDAEVAFEPPLDSVEAITFSVRTTAERFVAQLAHHQLVATGGAGRGRVRRRRLLVARLAAPALLRRPRPGRPGALAAAGRGSRRLAAGAQAVRRRCEPRSTGSGSCPRWSSRQPPTARRCGARASDDLVERGVARVQGMVGFDAVRRPVLQGGRSPAARQSLVPWGERAVDLRPVDRPWPGRVPGPAPVRVFADAAGRRGRGRRGSRRCASPTAGSSPASPGASGSRGAGDGGPAVAAGDRVGRAVADRRGLVVGRGRADRPLPGRRRRRTRLAAAARAGRLVPGGRL